MKVSIIGSGYVGTTTALCLSELGHETINIDIDPEVVENLNNGFLHIHEDGLQELLDRHLGNLFQATTDYQAVKKTDITFICLPTPSNEDGSLDLSIALEGARELGKHLRDKEGHQVVVKSTVLPGSTEKIGEVVLEQSGLNSDDLLLASNPEFLREGTAVHDFMDPDRIVLGGDSKAIENLKNLYKPLIDNGVDIFKTDIKTAEMIKYVSNSLLATKISFANEIGNICKKLEIDSYEVMDGVGLDKRVERSFLDSGIGFGGSCLTPEQKVLVRVNGELKYSSINKIFEIAKDTENKLEAYSLNLDTGEHGFNKISTLTKREYEGSLIEVKTSNGRILETTEDHPYITISDGWEVKKARDLTIDEKIPYANEFPEKPKESIDLLQIVKGKYSDLLIKPTETIDKEIKTNEDEWVSIEELENKLGEIPSNIQCRIKDLVDESVIESPITVDKDLYLLLGLYIQFGDIKKLTEMDKTVFKSTDNNEINKIENILKNFELPYKTTPGSVKKLTLENRVLTGLIEELCVSESRKKIPTPLYLEKNANKKAFLEGMFSKKPENEDELKLITSQDCLELGEETIILLGSLGNKTTIETNEKNLKTPLLKKQNNPVGRKVFKKDPKISRKERLKIFKEKQEGKTNNRQDGQADRITKLNSRKEKMDVYSMEVVENHTFTTSYGLIVHNCFPKDVRALKSKAIRENIEPKILDSVLKINQKQPRKIIDLLEQKIGDLNNKNIAILGLAFKPGTDDIRESRSIPIIKELKQKNAKITAHDPKATKNMKKKFPNIKYSKTPKKAIKNADACLILTDWREYKNLDINIPCIEGRRIDRCEGICW
ncbi:nucleotide sugar dehydrogenase [Methanonatronarchaeum sp. AMET-Sl]|uniref:nucleotide sugar dehydrogenase n=1 Tax=Methanonatronarchaeum sp. AMET-Sl TaxID=3037654 RepID=UPI00244E5966|nr:nucleotide sugar dehydrogenase [Methanonatronarchaeum sp. AMET-Sl]WGI18132.1 nucleotide sugar dehydrogenase [Methanonatronarchaeum sp. AMET-Sl]